MQLVHVDNGTVGTTAKELESWPNFRTKRVIDDLKSLAKALRNAPVVFRPTTTMAPCSSAATLPPTFWTPCSSFRTCRPSAPEDGHHCRAYSGCIHLPASSTFSPAGVLPEFLSATDNPLITTFAGQSLVGAYAVDDEGVPAQPVDVVVNGKLQNYLIGRNPIRRLFGVGTAGHGRAPVGQAAHSRSGVMIFKSSAPLTAAKMNERLLAMAKEQGATTSIT